MSNREPRSYQDVLNALEAYKSGFRRSDLPEWELGPILSLFPECDCLHGASLTWNNPWPHGARQGIYFIFGQQFHLLYIGKASMGNSIGARLSQWFQGPTEGSCRVVHPGWSEQPKFVTTLAMPEGMGFEAPSIEEFLIRELQPPDNGVGLG